MKLETRVGSLFESPDMDALAHGCNCAGAMGAGIAKEFKRRFPHVRKVSRQILLRDSSWVTIRGKEIADRLDGASAPAGGGAFHDDDGLRLVHGVEATARMAPTD